MRAVVPMFPAEKYTDVKSWVLKRAARGARGLLRVCLTRKICWVRWKKTYLTVFTEISIILPGSFMTWGAEKK